ncbi:MAG: response regulator [Candidatus Eisenbacteria sp.]|nr:response regulator [Candidatus Eisenbacteria bacterium]
MGHRVLLVDDESHVTEGLKRALRREPYEILTTGSAREALAVLAREKVDVVVSDERMPVMSGSEFLAEVYRIYPETIRIVLTGQASLEAAVSAINEGRIYRFLMKPCNEVELAITIRQALEHKDLMEENERLLKTVKRQSILLEDLEREHPGIASLKRSSTGAIVIDEEDFEPEALTAHRGARRGREG